MRAICNLTALAFTVYGAVTLFAADRWVWGIVSFLLPPIAWVHGAGHLLGAW